MLRFFLFTTLLFIFSLSLCSCRPQKNVLVWMCLERCGGNSTTIHQNVQQVQQLVQSQLLNEVAFELFNLGPNSTLVSNNLTDINNILKHQVPSVSRYAMVSSYPYPDQFIDWMRQLFANPQPFTAHCIEEMHTRQLDGFNIDFEPSTGATQADGIAYAQWLNQFSLDIQQAGGRVSADVASWSPIWNLTDIGSSSINTVLTMSTYTGTFSSFERALNQAQTDIPAQKLAIGLQTTNTQTNAPYTDQELSQRFDLLIKNNVQALGIWLAPIPKNWIPYLKDFQTM
mmetsp:Transcript_15534/g.23301  ORF Transcript_15534/g.23301 Transcript_15534/m.23301 type:complete len:285 (+) Transcript_15534:37-891(+)